CAVDRDARCDGSILRRLIRTRVVGKVISRYDATRQIIRGHIQRAHCTYCHLPPVKTTGLPLFEYERSPSFGGAGVKVCPAAVARKRRESLVPNNRPATEPGCIKLSMIAWRSVSVGLRPFAVWKSCAA